MSAAAPARRAAPLHGAVRGSRPRAPSTAPLRQLPPACNKYLAFHPAPPARHIARSLLVLSTLLYAPPDPPRFRTFTFYSPRADWPRPCTSTASHASKQRIHTPPMITRRWPSRRRPFPPCTSPRASQTPPVSSGRQARRRASHSSKRARDRIRAGLRIPACVDWPCSRPPRLRPCVALWPRWQVSGIRAPAESSAANWAPRHSLCARAAARAGVGASRAANVLIRARRAERRAQSHRPPPLPSLLPSSSSSPLARLFLFLSSLVCKNVYEHHLPRR